MNRVLFADLFLNGYCLGISERVIYLNREENAKILKKCDKILHLDMINPD